MSSRRVEDQHISTINKILSSVGLVCARSPSVSEELLSLSSVSEDSGQLIEEEKEQEEPKPQEEPIAEEEEVIEEEKRIFPTPSLRHVLTDKQRAAEKQNSIHVLPNTFKTDFDPADIPKIATTPQQKYIDIIAGLLGCTKYQSSLAEYWFLDTMANLLRRAQDDDLDRSTQAVLMLWFCEWMKEIQHFDAADRPRMLRRFKDNMLSAARYIVHEGSLPTPEQAGVYYLPLEDNEVPKESNTNDAMTVMSVPVDENAYACSLRDLMTIMHYIFDLFSTDYQFDLVRSIFTFSPEYYLIDTPYQMQVPKRLYAPLKIKPKKDKPAKKAEKGKVKGKKQAEPDTAEYLVLMELKAKEEKLLDEQEEAARESWNLRSHILPLGLAATSELFDKYWPPPTPEPLPPEPEIKSKKKKK